MGMVCTSGCDCLPVLTHSDGEGQRDGPHGGGHGGLALPGARPQVEQGPRHGRVALHTHARQEQRAANHVADAHHLHILKGRTLRGRLPSAAPRSYGASNEA